MSQLLGQRMTLPSVMNNAGVGAFEPTNRACSAGPCRKLDRIVGEGTAATCRPNPWLRSLALLPVSPLSASH